MKSEGFKSRINENGRIVIPAEIRKTMGLKPGDSVVMSLEDGVLRIESQRAKMRRIQEDFKPFAKPEAGLQTSWLPNAAKKRGARWRSGLASSMDLDSPGLGAEVDIIRYESKPGGSVATRPPGCGDRAPGYRRTPTGCSDACWP